MVRVLSFVVVALIFVQLAVRARVQWRQTGNRGGAGGMVVYGLAMLALAFWELFLR